MSRRRRKPLSRRRLVSPSDGGEPGGGRGAENPLPCVRTPLPCLAFGRVLGTSMARNCRIRNFRAPLWCGGFASCGKAPDRRKRPCASISQIFRIRPFRAIVCGRARRRRISRAPASALVPFAPRRTSHPAAPELDPVASHRATPRPVAPRRVSHRPARAGARPGGRASERMHRRVDG